MQKRVAITGMGLISAIGNNVPENLESLKAGQTGIGRVSRLNTRLADTVLVGEIELDDAELRAESDIADDLVCTRTALLAIKASKEALRSAGLNEKKEPGLGLISSTTVGGMDVTERNFYGYLDTQENLAYIESHHAGHSSQVLANHLGIEDGFVTTISTACSSASNAIMLGARMINAGLLDKVLVGGTDCLSKFTMNGFNSLMILSNTYSQPFDEERKGLNLGEGAAFLVLESDSSCSQRGAKPIGYLSGYGNANDAHHQTASSEDGDGATASMLKALERSGLQSSDIDYINAHGTATRNNDLSEGRAFLRVFGEEMPPFSSTKAFTGHTLAAAGGVEAVFSLLAIQKQLILPNLNFKNAMVEFDLVPVTETYEAPLKHILSNSLGFGGNCSTLIFSAP